MSITVWVVLTVAFVVVAFTTDPGKLAVGMTAAQSGQDPSAAVNAYLAATNQNVPVLHRYVNWLTGLVTFNLGWSFTYDAPVASLLLDRFAYTLVYFVPALLFAVVAGTGIRVYTVAAESSRLDRLTDGISYVGVSVPVFLFAYMLKWWVLPYYYVTTNDEIAYYVSVGPLAPENVQAAVYPGLVVGLYLLGIQLRYSGTELDEYASASFVKTARGKGASVWRVGRHMFRNTVVSLLTLFFTDMFGMVLVAVYVVEAIANVPGFGQLTLKAMQGGHDLPLMLGVTLLPVLSGVVANFVQDIAYALFYPRLDIR